MSSCSSDDYTDKVSSVQVTAAETLLAVTGETKNITVTGDGISATAADEWLTTSVNGNVVSVTAEANVSRESRHTIVTIKATNGDQAIVNVSQLGAIFYVEKPEASSFGNDARIITYYVNSNYPVTASSSSDWAVPTISDGKVEIALGQNDTGHMRSAMVYINSDVASDSVEVTQCNFDTDILGKSFYFAGYDLTSDDYPLTAELATFRKEGNNYVLYFPEYQWTVPASLSNSTEANIYLTDSIGIFVDEDSTVYQMAFVGWDLEQGYISYDPSISLTVSFYYDEDFQATMAEINDNGSWDGFTVTGLRFEAFYMGRRLGALSAIGYPWLQEIVQNASDAPKRAIKKGTLKLNTKPVIFK